MMRGFLAPFVLLGAQLVGAHYNFPQTIYNGVTSTEWQYVRMTASHYDQGPVTDINSQALRCYELDSTIAGSTGTLSVTAGSRIGFQANNIMGHPGYFAAYMTAANPANSNSAGTGKTWFKIWEWAPKWSTSTGLVFDSININQLNFTIPKSLRNGQYLLRVEQIALHLAGNANGAQFYIGCAQINVSGGGSGTPSPLVSIPGVYKATDPGILINIYYQEPGTFTGYKSPGPAVWSG